MCRTSLAIGIGPGSLAVMDVSVQQLEATHACATHDVGKKHSLRSFGAAPQLLHMTTAELAVGDTHTSFEDSSFLSG